MSNGKKKGEGNTRNGNPYLCWAFIEAANFAMRFSAEARQFYERKKAKTNPVIDGDRQALIVDWRETTAIEWDVVPPSPMCRKTDRPQREPDLDWVQDVWQPRVVCERDGHVAAPKFFWGGKATRATGNRCTPIA